MTDYICKCGKHVKKSVDADNTGNRDTDGCDGCPYLMPWGEQKYNHDTKHFYLDVQGYECRMSHTLEYESRFSGSVTDKCSCYVASLDFDFLQRISDWIKATYPDGQISGSFSRDSIRSVEYVSNGRYRMAITCAQNKSGMAAKAALLHQFFDDGGNRLDLDPEAEKEKILQDIRRGIDIDSGPDPAAAASTTEVPAAQPNAKTDGAVNCAPALTGESAVASTAFDYSGLDAQDVEDLHLAEREYSAGKRMAEAGFRRMADGVAIAHDTLVAQCDNSKHGNRGEDTFRAWCASVGISKDTAYRLLQVADLLDKSSPNEQKILEQAPATLLYAAAKPSAPAEAVEAVKSGDIKSMPEYKALLDELAAVKREAELDRKERETANKQADRLLAERNSFNQEVGRLQQENRKKDAELDSAVSRAQSAEHEKTEAEKERDGARQALQASKMRADKWQAEAEAAHNVPIPAEVVDQDEVQRRAKELADQMVAAQQESSDAAHNAYDAVILACRTFTNTWQTVQPLLPQIPAGQRTSAREMLLQKLNEIKEDAIQCL